MIHPISKINIGISKEIVDIKDEVEKVAKMTIDTNHIPHPQKVEQIFRCAIEQPDILEFLLKMRSASDVGRLRFYRYIKNSIFATVIGINLNMENDELILLARAYLIYDIHYKTFLSNKELREKNRQLNKENYKIKTLNEKLKIISVQDNLTKVLNRNGYEEYLHSEWTQATRTGDPLSVLLLDVDNFKSYNDTYGHQSGDVILKKVAMTIQESVRGSDIVGRYGGEEFIIILPRTNREMANVTAEKIRSNIENLRIKHPLSKVTPYLTVSIGGTTFFPKATDVSTEQLINDVDQFLFQAKRKGRNQVLMSPKKE
ncbi:GGDEF domain-containing protein [Calidifontibacillus oryziterrae]|uniref:GGDEF domain-containing protein n=1 Tax=Calidifontibacillus oryziterrae TaxID=1191699 RepID=UPI0002DA9869|nr:diguanylate cyclase [Calidifontibacillus oryziterrae]